MGLAATVRSWRRGRNERAAGRPSAGGQSLREFFRYHGAMAPGVRVLRNLPMGAKIGAVAAAFVVPLAFIALVLTGEMNERIDALRSQQAALQRWQQADAAQVAVRLQRLDHVARAVKAPGPPAATAGLLDPSVPVRGADVEPGGRGASGLKRLRDAMARVAAASEGSEARFHALLDASEEAHAFARSISRGAFDRDAKLADDERVEFTMRHLPRLAERLAAVADLAALSLAAPGDERLRIRLLEILPDLERVHAETAATAGRLVEAGFEGFVGYARDVTPLVQTIHDRAVGILRDESPAESARKLVANGLRAHETLRRLQEDSLADLERRLAERAEKLERGRLGVLLGLLLLTALPIYLLMALHRVMSGGMEKVIEEVRRMSTGDLSERPLAYGRDEVAGALNSLSTSLSMLGDMFSHVRQGAAAVAHASGEIARGNTDLEQRTVNSREGLVRVIDAVRACVALLDQCGRRVDETVAVVDAMRLDAARSRANMGALEKRMLDLRRKSGEIDAIVELIDGIAFRTNILALNASIESSKAGEAGRGFSVVAQEVRRLAQRSADNARQISEIIGGAREDIERGAALADHTGADLKSTDALVLQVHDAMRDVVQLTRQGQQRSQQILDEVRDLMSLTDANGELVHQIAGASQALSAQGGELSQRVENFKLT